MELQVVQATSTVVLHAKELLIKSASYVTEAGETIEVVGMNNNLKLHTLTFTFASALPVGTYVPLSLPCQST